MGSTTLPPPGSPVADFTFAGVTGGTIDGAGNVTGAPPINLNVVDASANAQTWEWDWGDLSPHIFLKNPGAHEYPSQGTFTVTLKVTNTQGPPSIRSRTVTVQATPPPPPIADFYGTPVGSAPQAQGGGATGANISGSRTLKVNFTNMSSNANAYSWDFGRRVAGRHDRAWC